MIYVPATAYDARCVGARMRDTDRAEMAALGHDPLTIPMTSLCLSDPDLRWSLLDQGRAVGVCGASRLNDEVGIVWLLTANGFGRDVRAVQKITRELLDKMHSRYPILFNWIDDRNLRSLRWLRAAGFFPTVTDPDYAGSGHSFTCHVSLRHV